MEAQQARAVASGAGREQSSNYRELQAATELHRRYEKEGDFGGMVLNPDLRDEYERAYRIMHELLEAGTAPARAVDEAQRRARAGRSGGSGGGNGDSSVTSVSSQEEHARLPSGTAYRAPDGTTRTKTMR